MTNKVELLRSICFDQEDINNITNLGDAFSSTDIEFMIEFKKIYELGLDQLQKFINKMDAEGSKLDVFSLKYYVDVLTNGPLGKFIADMSGDKIYFADLPETIGCVGDKQSTTTNTTIYPDSPYPLGTTVDVYTKLPSYMQATVNDSVKGVEDVFRTSIAGVYAMDDTSPIMDKNPQNRYEKELSGALVKTAHGNKMVKDGAYRTTISKISDSVFSAIKGQIGDEKYRLYSEFKKFNYFDSSKNESVAIPSVIQKTVKDGDESRVVNLDLLGDEYDSDEKRKAVLIVTDVEKDREYKLHSNTGQIGDGDA